MISCWELATNASSRNHKGQYLIGLELKLNRLSLPKLQKRRSMHGMSASVVRSGALEALTLEHLLGWLDQLRLAIL
jgi:hypothetical protein